MTADKIKPHHLARKAIVYVRQWSGPQFDRTRGATVSDRLASQAGRHGVLVRTMALRMLSRRWSGPHQTGQAAWLADCRAMNSRGERMRKPECGWMVL